MSPSTALWSIQKNIFLFPHNPPSTAPKNQKKQMVKLSDEQLVSELGCTHRSTEFGDVFVLPHMTLMHNVIRNFVGIPNFYVSIRDLDVSDTPDIKPRTDADSYLGSVLPRFTATPFHGTPVTNPERFDVKTVRSVNPAKVAIIATVADDNLDQQEPEENTASTILRDINNRFGTSFLFDPSMDEPFYTAKVHGLRLHNAVKDMITFQGWHVLVFPVVEVNHVFHPADGTEKLLDSIDFMKWRAEIDYNIEASPSTEFWDAYPDRHALVRAVTWKPQRALKKRRFAPAFSSEIVKADNGGCTSDETEDCYESHYVLGYCANPETNNKKALPFNDSNVPPVKNKIFKYKSKGSASPKYTPPGGFEDVFSSIPINY